ncbi:MAG TPA: type II toxin-antitoxin system VapC family toxin [Chryseosolibacter sp.]|nr:type II toxin-antitoxin system VapC family toxin [Chryseosolibacter sp.]
MIVVDTNIIAYMTFPSAYSSGVGSLHEKDPIWEAPLLWKSEFLSVIALYYRKGIINYEEGLAALEFAERLIGSREHEVAARAIMDAVIGSTCSSYDYHFIVLARQLGTKLITYDKKLLGEFPAIALTPDAYLQQ